jgi:quercetin 2,3-dioxygenase
MFGPADLAPRQVGGVPAHPHRGFEMVTYMLGGIFKHKDSQGHQASLIPEMFNGLLQAQA